MILQSWSPDSFTDKLGDLMKMFQDPAFNLVDSVCGRNGGNLQLARSNSHGRRQVPIAGEDADDDKWIYGK